jgi:hypothetical protein
MADNAPDALDVLKEDLAGLYQAHVRALEDFSGRRLTAVLLIYVLPLACLGALVAAEDKSLHPDLSNLFAFPAVANVVFIASAFIGFGSVQLLVSGYVLGQWYSRAINELRGLYGPLLAREPLKLERGFVWLPTNPWKPGVDHAWFILLVAATFSGLSGVYVAVGVLGLLPWTREHRILGYVLVAAGAATSARGAYILFKSRIARALPDAPPPRVTEVL